MSRVMPRARYIARGSSLAGFAQVAGGERDDAEAQVGEERERDARDDVRDGRIAAEREQSRSMSASVTTMKTAKTASTTTTISDCALATSRGPDDVDDRHRDDDRRGEDVVPASRRVVTDEERRRIAAERDGDHRADDHDRGEVAEPRRDADESPVPEALRQIRDQAARRRVAHAELDEDVAEQRRTTSPRAGTRARPRNRRPRPPRRAARRCRRRPWRRCRGRRRRGRSAHGSVVVGTGGAGV